MYHCIHHILLSHSSVDGDLGYCYPFCDDNAAVDICVPVVMRMCIFSYLRYIPRSGITGPMFNLLRNWKTVFQHNYTIYIHSSNV